MTGEACGDNSHLFTVRLWLEDLGDGEVEYRGQAQHVLSGETRFFRDWATLAAFVAERVTAAQAQAEHEGVTT